MKLTNEQADIIKAITEHELVSVSAVAGSGKTATLLASVEELKPKKALYLAFNKAIAEEAKLKFPYSVECRTIHSLAYSIVRPKKVEELSYTTMDMTDYDNSEVYKAIGLVNEFFNSKYLNIHEFLENKGKLPKCIEVICTTYLDAMTDGKIPVPFGYLIKVLHFMLKEGSLKLNYDLVMLDECADVTATTLEIFQLINAKHKIMVGDKYQNIYGFMNTVNGFDKVDSVQMKLTNSFRVSKRIGETVSNFCTKYIDKDFEFHGLNEDISDNTYAYISRTNSQLIEKMAELLEVGDSFSTLRPVSDIFALPLELINVSKGKAVYNNKYKFLEKARKEYTISGAKTFFDYLRKEFATDIELMNAIRLIQKFSKRNIKIFDIFFRAKAVKPNKSFVLTTAHTSKGLEFGTVEIADDLIETINKIVEQKGGAENQEDLAEFNLMYVAMTRAKHTLYTSED